MIKYLLIDKYNRIKNISENGNGFDSSIFKIEKIDVAKEELDNFSQGYRGYFKDGKIVFEETQGQTITKEIDKLKDIEEVKKFLTKILT